MAYLRSNCVVIPDCANYSGRQVKEQLVELRVKNPDNEGLKIRSDCSYLNEWAVHALCYNWNINKERAKDADMEFELALKWKILFGLTGPFARFILWLFY